MEPSPPSPVRAIVTDPHLWVPIVVLIIGVVLLVCVR
jgi:hypothetical protein